MITNNMIICLAILNIHDVPNSNKRSDTSD